MNDLDSVRGGGQTDKPTGELSPIEKMRQAAPSLQPTNENLTPTPAPAPIQTGEDSADVPPVVESQVPEELRNTDWYRDMPAEVRAQVDKGLTPDIDVNDIDAALKASEQDALEEINYAQRQLGRDEVTTEEFKKGEIESANLIQDGVHVDPKAIAGTPSIEEEDFEAQFLKMINGETEEDEDDEDTQIRKMRELREHLEEGQEVIPDDAIDSFTSKYAPLSVKISRNTEYEETLKTVMDSNDIKYKTSKKGALKKAALKAYSQKNPHVTTPLINSGIYLTLSGATVPEVMQMNNIRTNTRTEGELKKFDFIHRHLVGSSLGEKIPKHELMKVIHLQDVQTLWYNLYIGTFPDPVEFPMNCFSPSCNAKINIKVNAADLVLNYKDFKSEADYILYKATTFKDLSNQSSLSKIAEATLPESGVRVAIKSPSFYDSIMTTGRIEELVRKKKDLSQYEDVIGYLIFLQWVAIPASDGEFLRFKDFDEMLEILQGLDEDDRDALDNEIERFVQKDTIKYGIREFTCPTCGHKHKETPIDLDQMLFMCSQVRMTIKNLERYERRENEKNTTTSS